MTPCHGIAGRAQDGLLRAQTHERNFAVQQGPRNANLLLELARHVIDTRFEPLCLESRGVLLV